MSSKIINLENNEYIIISNDNGNKEILKILGKNIFA